MRPAVKRRVRNNNYAQSEKKKNLKSPLLRLPDARMTFRVQEMQRILIKIKLNCPFSMSPISRH